MVKLILTVAFFVLVLTKIDSQAVWSFTLQGGSAWNVSLPLWIHQAGKPDIHFNAHFRSESFDLPVYWDWRFTRWNNQNAWEFEAIHHKLYLENTTREVTKFNLSHGYNMVIVNRVNHMKCIDCRWGGGIVLAHPENTVRGKSFGDSVDPTDLGYHVAGPLVNFSLGRPIYLFNRTFFNLEARSTFSWARVPVADGHASLFNWAFQLVAGFGFDFIHTNYPGRKED